MCPNADVGKPELMIFVDSTVSSVVGFCSPDQIFVHLLCGVDVRINGVLILTEFSPKTQVLEEAKQKLSSFPSPHHVVVLRVLLLQHLVGQRTTSNETQTKTNRWMKKERERVTCRSSS